MSMLRVVYPIAVAVFVIMLVVFGISAFYEGPTATELSSPPPEYPKTYGIPPVEGSPEYAAWEADMAAAEGDWRQWDAENQDIWQAHERNLKYHHRNIFYITYPIGLLLVVLGLELKLRLDVLRPGLVLGGMGVIIYAVSQPNLSDEIRFIGVAIGLAILIYIGYRTLTERNILKKQTTA